MRTMTMTLIAAFFSFSAWAHNTDSAATSHPTSTSNAAVVEDSGLSGSATEADSSYSEDHSAMSGSSTGWTDRNEIPSAESERLSGSSSSLSGASTPAPFGNTMNDHNKALEMCRSLNPDRNCADVAMACRGQANLESCLQRSAQ